MGDRRVVRAYRRASGSPFTYPEVGATARRPLPGGYGIVRERIKVGEGDDAFARASAYVMAWGPQRGTGFDVHPSGRDAAEGDTVVITLRLRLPGGLPVPRIRIPCRVTWTVDEPDRAGFAYGTLRGHPETGEESFLVVKDADGSVWFDVDAFANMKAWYARLMPPLSRWIQHRAIGQYLEAVRRATA